MIYRSVLLGLILVAAALGQPTCPETPTYSPCDLVFEMSAEEAAKHPTPYQTVQIRAEVRSPESRTYLGP